MKNDILTECARRCVAIDPDGDGGFALTSTDTDRILAKSASYDELVERMRQLPVMCNGRLEPLHLLFTVEEQSAFRAYESSREALLVHICRNGEQEQEILIPWAEVRLALSEHESMSGGPI